MRWKVVVHTMLHVRRPSARDAPVVKLVPALHWIKRIEGTQELLVIKMRCTRRESSIIGARSD